MPSWLSPVKRLIRNQQIEGSNPSDGLRFSNKCSKHSIDTLQRKLILKNLSDKTIKIYSRCLKIFNTFIKNQDVTRELIEEYLIKSKNRRNNLAPLRVLYPELSNNIKFPKRKLKPKILPNKEQLMIFYNNLPSQYKPIFLLLGESGLRVSELLNANFDTVTKMIIPKSHEGQTKHSWISFYQTAFDSLLQITVDGLSHAFLKNSTSTGIKVYPHLLLSIFAREMSRAGVQDRFIDAFCGRIPQSVLARSYSDYSTEVMKEIYSKANIKILE